MIGGSQSDSYDRNNYLKAFNEGETGVKALIDAVVEKIPSIFMRPQEDLSQGFDTRHENSVIPVIDLAHAHQKDRRREVVIERIIWASEKWGFFQVVNHGIPLEILDKVIEGVRMFHEQDVEVKKEYYSRDNLHEAGQVKFQPGFVSFKGC